MCPSLRNWRAVWTGAICKNNMLFVFTGTDREKARAALEKRIQKEAKDVRVVRITDAHMLSDFTAALQGGGMFAEKRVLVFENVCKNEEMEPVLIEALPRLAASEEKTFVYEAKPLADLKKQLQKHAESTETFDLPKRGRENDIFALANALRARNKKQLWVGYMREVAKGSAPEATHGFLFWAAKDMYLKSGGRDVGAAKFVAELAELPHVARRKGEELDYALERFVLSVK